MTREVPESVLLPHRRVETEIPVQTFESIGVVGAKGQTGRLYMETLAAAFPKLPIAAIDSDPREINFEGKVELFTDVATALHPQEGQGKRPDALILATTNPTRELLQTIADNLDDKPLTLILPQNGIAVVSIAQEIFKDKPVTLIRASLFTSSVNKDGGTIFYNKEKLRIGFAWVPEDKSETYNAAKEAEMQKVAAMFRQAKFDVATFKGNYEDMEWTKLVLNAMVSTDGVTGFTPEETCNDPELYELEMKAAADRLKILKAAGIEYQAIHWGGANLLPFDTKPGAKKIRNFGPIKNQIIKKIIAGRDNKPSGAWLNIMAGKTTELTYYHQPFIELAIQYNAPRSFVDEAILAVYKLHTTGEIDLTKLTPQQRKRLLLETHQDLVKQAGKSA